MSPTPFRQASALAQIRRLRAVASEAVTRFPIRARKISFIHHGENTTFEIDAAGGKKFLLRVHRHGYHTRAAILEEMRWLDRLSKQDELATPRPLRSKSGSLLETAGGPGLDAARECSLLHWVDGRFVFKAARPVHFERIGTAIARLHESTRGVDVKHRRYWTAGGLVGPQPKFGEYKNLPGATQREQRIIDEAKNKSYRELLSYERKFPERMGLVHADLHFGNFLFQDGSLGVIDFDDCGLGFHAYDFAVPLVALPMALGESRLGEIPRYREAMLNAYAKAASFDEHDDRAVTSLVIARRLSILSWINHRIDHPGLRARLKGVIERAVAHIDRTKYLD